MFVATLMIRYVPGEVENGTIVEEDDGAELDEVVDVVKADPELVVDEICVVCCGSDVPLVVVPAVGRCAVVL